jgi:prepilin-type N-terminal cleavage/methylation domain-containing protein
MQLKNMTQRSQQTVRGFTLVEMAIVLVIVGLILGGILTARSIIRSAQVKDGIKALNDMTAAAQQFRDRYGMWPGDFTNATAQIASLVCANGNGDGQVSSAAESDCASESLIRAGLIRGTAGQPVRMRDTTFSITGATAALSGVTGLPAGWVNVVRVQTLDCDMAVQMDKAVDDGNLSTGSFRSNAAACGASNDLQDESQPAGDVAYKLN